MAEQGKVRMRAEWDPKTGRLKSVDFIPPEKDDSEELPTEQVEPPIDTLPYPLEESRGDLLRRLGASGASSAFGD